MAFIEVNGRILDYDDYCDNVGTICRFIDEDVEEFLATLGFVRREDYFYNEQLDLIVTFIVEKANDERFV